jgi:hypothetical protein
MTVFIFTALAAAGPFGVPAAPRFLERRLIARFSPRAIVGITVTRIAAAEIAAAGFAGVVFVVVKSFRRGVFVVLGRNDVVEPFADRHAGFARGRAGGFARFWTEASQIPRTARFHCAPNPIARSRMALFLSCGSVTAEAEGAASSESDFSGLE